MDYTRSQIRQEVIDLIADPSNQLVSIAMFNRAIDRVVRRFVEQTECNRDVMIVSFADSTSNGVVEYSMLSLETAVPRTDMEGWSIYTIPDCLVVDSIDRWITSSDGYPTEMSPVDKNAIDIMGLLFSTQAVPVAFQMVDKDKFRMLSALESTGYPHKIIIVYRMKQTDMISDSSYPDEDGTGQAVGTVTLDDLTGSIAGYTGARSQTVDISTFAGDPVNPNTFKWRIDGGAWSVATAMDTVAISLGTTGITVRWGAKTGHTTGDAWKIFTDDKAVPTVPEEYRTGLIYLVAAELSMSGRYLDLQAANTYMSLGREIQDQAYKQASRLVRDQTKRIDSRYTAAGFY